MKEYNLEKLAGVYQKLKGSIFLRLVPHYLRHKFYGEEAFVSGKFIAIDDDNWLLILKNDMTFGQWLQIKGVIK
jgi:hypothetical protein